MPHVILLMGAIRFEMQSRGFVRSDALRAFYFLLADMADRFHLLKYGLAICASVHRRQDAGDALVPLAGAMVARHRGQHHCRLGAS